MPTSKPRITVTLSEEQHAVLRQISAAGGQSMSGVISEFMLMAQPVLERMAGEFKQLKQQREADRQLVVNMLSKLLAERVGKVVSPLSRASPDLPMTVSLKGREHSAPAVGAEPDALQFCASVDYVRPNPSTAHDCLEGDQEVEPVYVKQKLGASRRTNISAGSVKGASKRAKK
jgi:hypothetical protein